MPHRYTDVDRLILGKWQETVALRQAFDDLLDRMQDVVEGVLSRYQNNLESKGWHCDWQAKHPSLSFWKPEWETKTSKQAGVYLHVLDFAPTHYGKGTDPTPSIWLRTEDFGRLKFKESSEDFGKAVRATLPPGTLAIWDDPGCDPSEMPLGRELTDVNEMQRVAWMHDTDALTSFLDRACKELSELVPAVDETLARMSKR